MFSVTVADHVMIAHSLKGAVFGPAQGLHGATYVVEVELRRPQLDPDGIVVDIGRALQSLAAALQPLKFRNLDAAPELHGLNTTTEFLCRWVFDRLAAALQRGDLGAHAAGITGMKVTLRESPVAWASYEGSVGT